METPLEYAGRRFSKFALDVIQPAIWRDAFPLAIEAAQFPHAVPHAQAVAADFHPVRTGWHWGPAWSTCWFRVRGEIPDALRREPLALRFSSSTEATLWIDGAPRQGFDRNRDAFMLDESLRARRSIDLHIEAACNHPFGTSTFWWDPAADRERWDSPTPGRLDRCELAVFDPRVWRLHRAFEFARLVLAELVKDKAMDSLRAHELCEALTRAHQMIDDRDVASGAARATGVIEAALTRGAAPSATRCVAVGHAHIDTAWLWPIRETRRKCVRSWSNVLRLMDQFPAFNFLCSQAQQYAWVEQDAPTLFNEIKRRVSEQRWEPLGAMWIEPDCSCPSGESFIRQILHGVGYWRDKFGDAPRQRLLYLPDTFGFPATLPQIMKLAGIDIFITNKMSWNERNEFPFMTFNWRGLDGSEVLAHFTPGHDYNASNTPLELRRGESNCARKDQGLTNLWLQPFGFGDGGGGPTDWQIQNAIHSNNCEGLPRTEMGSTSRFIDDLHASWTSACDALRASDRRPPTWDGEMYLELHRGTFTSQAFVKKANRQAEQRLRIAEWLLFAGPSALSNDDRRDAWVRLDEAWKITLLNQFHDILPGSSIGPVYEGALKDHERVRSITDELIKQAREHWLNGPGSAAAPDAVTVFNPTSHDASGVVECDGHLFFADAPAMGMATAQRGTMLASPLAKCDGRTLSNGLLKAVIDDAGRIASLRCGDRESCAIDDDGTLSPINQLVLYEDRPRSWEAWDIDADYELKPNFVDSPAERIDVMNRCPLRAEIAVERSIGRASRITQRYRLDQCSPRLDVITRIDWREDHRLLRALFPVNVRSRFATYDIQFGHIQRSTTRNSSIEQAMYEVCAHQWMDVSEHDFGVAILNDGKYGWSCDANVLGLSLLRSPKWPDPNCDMGVHEFTYSIMPHAGSGGWRAAGVDRQAALLNAPLFVADRSAGGAQESWSPFRMTGDGAEGVTIAALKPTHDSADARLILRLVETHGGSCAMSLDWTLPVRSVASVNLLEQPLLIDGIQHDAHNRRTAIALKPFQILTLAITLDRAAR